jgi:hypothetical protein
MKLEEILLRHDENLIIMGDTNINCNDKLDLNYREFMNILECYNYRIINSAPTRFNAITGNHSVIDQIITRDIAGDSSEITLTSDENIIENISDHNFLMYIQPGNLEDTRNARVITTKRVNKNKVITTLKQQFSSVPINLNPEIHCKDILQKIKEVRENNTIKITLKTHDNIKVIPDWMDIHYITMANTIINMKSKISKLESESRPTSLLKVRLRRLEAEKEEYAYKRVLWFHNDRINLNTKEMWKVLNEMSGKTKLKPTIKLNVDGMITSDEKKVADCFQKYFLSIVGTKRVEDDNEITSSPIARSANRFSFKHVEESKIKLHIQNLDVGKAAGIDEISPFVWKQLQDDASKSIKILFNSIVDKCIFPSALKETVVVPIYKSGAVFEASNYRPVSIPISLNKIIEREIYEQIEEHMKTNQLCDIYQYGFTKGKGCSDIIGKVVAQTSKAIDEGKVVILISLDLSKAFDRLNHILLIKKLMELGFDRNALRLIKNYLSNRVQYVRIGDKLSFIGWILSGVPQGTNLGPLLFSIFINDMKYLPTHSKVYKFADDALLLFEMDINNSKDINYAEILRKDLQLIAEYYTQNKLILNLEKSQAIIIGNVHPKEVIDVLSSFNIMIKDEMRYLGILLDNQLKFMSHLHATKMKLNQAIGVVAVLRSRLMHNPLMSFYFSNFQSHLMYSTFLLIRLRTMDLKQLQILQNRIIKIIYKLPILTSTVDLYTKYAPTILPIMGIIFYTIALMIHKSLHSTDVSLIKVERLRSVRVNMLKTGKSSLTIRSNDIEIIGPSIFNSLPVELRSTSSHPLFKRRLKQFLLDRNDSLSSDIQISTRNRIL